MFKSPLGKHHNNNYFKQEPLIHAIIGRQKLEKHNIYIISKHLPLQHIFINCNGKYRKPFSARILSDISLDN